MTVASVTFGASIEPIPAIERILAREEALTEAMREPQEAFRPWGSAIIHYAACRRAESD